MMIYLDYVVLQNYVSENTKFYMIMYDHILSYKKIKKMYLHCETFFLSTISALYSIIFI